MINILEIEINLNFRNLKKVMILVIMEFIFSNIYLIVYIIQFKLIKIMGGKRKRNKNTNKRY